jgi:hypothetical protein
MFNTIRTVVVIAAAVTNAALTPACAQTVLRDSVQFTSRQTWKTISLGTYANAPELLNALDHTSIHVGDVARQMLGRPDFAVTAQQTEAQLVVLSPADLGFRDRAPLDAIYARAHDLGYELCSREVAVQLRMQYRNQRVTEFLDIAMEPIAIDSGEHARLTIGNAGTGLLLVGQIVSDEAPDIVTRFVFVRPLRIAEGDR